MKPGELFWQPYSLDGFLEINNLGDIRDTRTEAPQIPVFADPVFEQARQEAVREARAREAVERMQRRRERRKDRER